MAIQGEGNKGTNMGQAFSAASGAREQAQPPHEMGGGDAPVYGVKEAMGWRMPSYIQPTNDVLSKIRTKIQQFVEANPDPSFKVDIHTIDSNTPGVNLALSLVVIAFSEKANPALGVAFHSLILAASGEPFEPLILNSQIPGRGAIELDRVPGDAYDRDMRRVIAVEMRRLYPDMLHFDADAEVVPREFNLEDPQRIAVLASNALRACYMVWKNNLPGQPAFSIGAGEQDNNLTISTTYNQHPIQNAVGEPVRSDILLKFTLGTGPQNNQQRSLNAQKALPIGHVAGYIDFVQLEQTQQNRYASPINNPYAPQQAPRPLFAPEFIITDLDVQNVSLASTLLMLIVAMQMQSPQAWWPAFKPNHMQGKEGDVDPRDIGALWIERNYENDPSGFGKPVDTKAADFDLASYLSAMVTPELILALDVPECGPNTWMLGIFAAAAKGDPKATSMIVAAANELTNGAFAHYFSGNGLVCGNESNRIQNGIWNGQNDLRDLDRLAVENLVGRVDPQKARDFSATYLRADFPIELRLDARRNVIKNALPDYRITGYSSRVVFYNDFRDALIQGATDAGLVIRSTASQMGINVAQVPHYQFAARTMSALTPSKIFTPSYSASPGAGFANVGGGRWA